MYDKVRNNRESILKNLFAYTLFILVFAVEGCFNFADSAFEVDRLLDISLWSRIALKVILLVLIRLGANLMFLDVARAQSTDLFRAKTVNERFMKLKSNDFSDYIITVKNKQIRIDAWKRRISKRLAKLEKKAKASDKALFYKNDMSSNYNKYCIKRRDLEKMLEPKWIEANFHLIQIKCPQLNPAIFDLPVGLDRNDRQYQLTSKTKSSILLGILSSSIMMILGQTLITATVFNYKDVTALEIFIGLMTDFVFIITQFFTGLIGAYSTIRNNEVLPYCNRNRILREYLYWKNPTDPDKFSKWIEQLEKVEKEEAKEA